MNNIKFEILFSNAHFLHFYFVLFCSTEFRSAPDVIQYDFSPPERQALMERAKQGLTDLIGVAIKLFFRVVEEFRNFKSLVDFKRAVLIPLIEELACVGVPFLIKLIKMTFF